MIAFRGAGRPGIRPLVFVYGMVLSLAASFVSAPGVSASGPSDCGLWDETDEQVEVREASDLNGLGSDDDCDGLTAVQMSDIDLDGWVGPSGNWFGTFDGNGFRFFDSGPLTAEEPLFDNPGDVLEIVNVVREGDVSGAGAIGGLVGSTLEPLTISHSSMTGRVSSPGSLVGGLVGDTFDPVVISDSFSDGPILGLGDLVGGLVGDTDAVITINRSYSVGPVEGDVTVGGLVGYGFGVRITDSYALGEISGTFYVGGLVGEVGPLDADISRSFSSGNVVANIDPLSLLTGSNGGLIGDAIGEVTISESYASGNMEGFDDTAGGLVGNGNTQDVTIIESYSIGDVNGGDPAVGGLIGDPGIGRLVVSNSFCLAGAEGCSTNSADEDDLKSRSYLEDDNGWDFESVWCIRSSMNGGFPVLRTISFGPGDTNNCRSRSGRVRREVTFDPAGGRCGEHSTPWTIGFRGSLLLPTAPECTRSGHVFLGWTRDPSRASIQDLLTSSISRSGSLTAVWGALPPAPASVAALANAWCLRCTSVLMIWDAPSEDGVTSDVSLDGAPAECAQSGELAGIEFCLINGLVSGSSHTVSVAWRNEYGLGPAGTVSFSLN